MRTVILVLAFFLSTLPTLLFASPPMDKKNITIAQMAGNGPSQLVNEAKSINPVVRSGAVLKIREMLEKSLTNEAMERDMVDLLIAADVITPLVKCLTTKNDNDDDMEEDDDDDDDSVDLYDDNEEDDDDYETKDNAARALAIIAEKRPNEAALVDTEQPFMKWLTSPKANKLMLKYRAPFLVKFAKSEMPPLTRAQAVHGILSTIELSLREERIDAFVSAGAIMPLVKCLANDEDDNLTKYDAAWALKYIDDFRPNEAALANIVQPLFQWLTNPPMQDDDFFNLATDFLGALAMSNDEAVKLQAVSAIHKALEESLTNGTNKKMIDKIMHYGISPLYACFEGNSPQPTLMPSARALEIIAEQCPEEMYRSHSHFFNDLLKWLQRPAELDDEVIKQMASIFKCLSAHIPSDHRKDKLDRILPLIVSQKPHIVEQAAFAAYNLIKKINQIPDLIKVEHIKNMMQFSADANLFYQFIEEGKSSDKITRKILLAIKLLLLNPTKNDEQIVKQIQQYRSEIEVFNTGSGTTAASILSLLENRIQIQRYTIVPTTTAAGPRISEISDTETKKVLDDAVKLLLYPDFFKSFSIQRFAILLFGEPGTGKESLAKAVANEAGAKLFSLSASAIIAKEANDAIEFVKMLFQMAKNSEPSAVIFIDKIDELLGRGKEIDEPLRYLMKQRVMAEFLVQMDNCYYPSSLSSSSANDCRHRVLVIGATNQPWEMNDNSLRCFVKLIYVEMPDKAAREKMLQKIIIQNPKDFRLSEAEIDKLAAMTENFSFDHLRTLCQEASFDALRSIEANVVLHSQQPVTITMKNFENAHQKMMPFTSEGNAKKLKQFAENNHFVKRQKV